MDDFEVVDGEGTVHHPLDGFNQQEYDQFIQKVGQIAFNIPMASEMVSHKWPAGIIRDYYDVGSSHQKNKIDLAAARYIKDLFTLPTAMLACKWRQDVFGSIENWSDAFHGVKNRGTGAASISQKLSEYRKKA
jgi:hypothetical protein